MLGQLISTLPDSILRCSTCGNYSDMLTCPICQDPRRDRRLICVVEQPQDVAVLEASHEFNGYYHILHGVLAPLDGVGPAELNLDSLAERLKENSIIEELVIATNPTVEGDATALYIKKMFEHLDIRITRPALGLPMGGDLEYADRYTLARSLKGRTDI